MEDHVTIIIRTYNRYSKLMRLLNYYESYDFPSRICVLDSSSHNMPVSLKDIFKTKPIEHFKYNSEIAPIAKLRQGMEDIGISTPYSVVASDDDFIVPSGIKSCINFLNKNDDYSVSHGHYIHFWTEGFQSLTSAGGQVIRLYQIHLQIQRIDFCLILQIMYPLSILFIERIS